MDGQTQVKIRELQRKLRGIRGELIEFKNLESLRLSKTRLRRKLDDLENQRPTWLNEDFENQIRKQEPKRAVATSLEGRARDLYAFALSFIRRKDRLARCHTLRLDQIQKVKRLQHEEKETQEDITLLLKQPSGKKDEEHNKSKGARGFNRLKKNAEMEAKVEAQPGWNTLADKQKAYGLMAWAYLIKKTEIADRFGVHRKTVDEALETAKRKLDNARENLRSAKASARRSQKA